MSKQTDNDRVSDQLDDIRSQLKRIADALEKLVTKVETVDRVQVVFDDSKPLEQ